jgi:hydrogenase/urease accessory protein HupE
MRRHSFALGLLALLPLPAAAHHPMDGAMPQTLWQGFASGIGHPVIGLDHLAFLLAAGVLAATLPRGEAFRAMAGFLAASMAGVALHLAGIGLGATEALVAASVLMVGLVPFTSLIPNARYMVDTDGQITPVVPAARPLLVQQVGQVTQCQQLLHQVGAQVQQVFAEFLQLIAFLL